VYNYSIKLYVSPSVYCEEQYVFAATLLQVVYPRWGNWLVTASPVQGISFLQFVSELCISFFCWSIPCLSYEDQYYNHSYTSLLSLITPSVCMKQLNNCWTNLHEILCCRILWKIVGSFWFSFRSDIFNDVTWKSIISYHIIISYLFHPVDQNTLICLYVFLFISLWIFIVVKMFRTNVVRKNETPIIYPIHFLPKSCNFRNH
jgi:hypothetical protein